MFSIYFPSTKCNYLKCFKKSDFFHKMTEMTGNARVLLRVVTARKVCWDCAWNMQRALQVLQGGPGFSLSTKAQGYHLNTEIFSLSFLHTHMSTFIICISRTGIWGAGESETEELNPNGDFRASAGKSPRAWSNQMQLRPI